jgi:hypothetical protein
MNIRSSGHPFNLSNSVRLPEPLMNYGIDYRNCGSALIDAMVVKLDKERIEVHNWATEAIKLRMKNKAITLNMRFKGEQVSRFQDIAGSWMEDSTEANARKLYQVMIGDYEHYKRGASWSEVMEREYMANCEIEYFEERKGGNKKGCYEKLIANAKTTRVKMLNIKFRKRILMSIPKNTRDKNDWRRRKKGDFYIYDNEKVKWRW